MTTMTPTVADPLGRQYPSGGRRARREVAWVAISSLRRSTRSAIGRPARVVYGSSESSGAQWEPLIWLPPSTKRVLPVR